MRVFGELADVYSYLNELSHVRSASLRPYTLGNMRRLMSFLGNPQNIPRAIHVAGTSGKSSTCHFLSEMLRQSGAKVGLTVSPHVYSIKERVQINGRPLTDKQFCTDFGKFVAKVEASSVRPTYYEIMVAFAFWEFAKRKVDYAVIEVGIGGLLDGTNVIDRPDKVCIITDIGIDHTEKLGKSLSLIAAQKAGIIKPTNPVFSYDQGDDIMPVVREVCEQNKSKLHELWPLRPSELPSNLPLYQRRNWFLAHRVFQYIRDRDAMSDLDEPQLLKTTQLNIPARMETRTIGGKTIVIDAAHNPHKLANLVKSLKHEYPGQRFDCMVSFLQSSQSKIKSNLKALQPIVDSLVITDFSVLNPGKEAADTKAIAKSCEALGYDQFRIISNPREAFSELVSSRSDFLLVTGSFFLPQTVKPIIINL